MIKFQKKHRSSFRLDLVPMINIVFLLLIFFMLTSTAMKSVLSVNLPKASSSDEISGENLIIKIDKDGVLEVGSKVVKSKLFLIEVKEVLASKKNATVEIHADKNIEFELFGNIIELARQAGAEEFIFATERMNSTNQ